jgi:hypothetical protein
MAMDMLRQLAGSPLPATFRTPAEIDQIKLLRAAGLVIALTPAPSDPLTLAGTSDAAQVLAITEKGREELARYEYPGDLPMSHIESHSPCTTGFDTLRIRKWMFGRRSPDQRPSTKP